jgi:cell division septal protein FtsQ
MASRTRENRRTIRSVRETSRPSRAPAILRGPVATAEPTRSSVQQVNAGRPIPWRIFSGLLVVSLTALLFVFFSVDVFYVRGISVSGIDYLNDSEVFALAGVSGEHVFAVDAAEVRRNLLASPSVADAVVTVGWGSPMVHIAVQERQPALMWQQAGIAMWVDVQGRIMRQREERDDLLQISAETLMDGPPGATVDRDVVAGALQLEALLPDLAALRYHPDFGLGFSDSRGWEVWFGTGTDMAEKLTIYLSTVDNLLRNNVTPRAIYVINPDRPWVATF